MSQPRFHTAALAPDGTPLIEFTIARRTAGSLYVEGSASVYEGTVVIRATSRNGSVELVTAQASAGGPERGTWQATIPSGPDLVRIVVGQEEMEEAAATRHNREVVVELIGPSPG